MSAFCQEEETNLHLNKTTNFLEQYLLDCGWQPQDLGNLQLLGAFEELPTGEIPWELHSFKGFFSISWLMVGSFFIFKATINSCCLHG